MHRMLALGLAVTAAAGLSGCVVSQPHLSDSYGVAVSQDVVAQITDPDHVYPAARPPTNGARMLLAQKRYRTGTTIPPIATASDVGVEQAAPIAPPGAAPGGASMGGP
jgi:hypothetical protein